MQSVNAQERPWKSSEVFDIKINSDSAQCTLQVSIPMPGTREKRDRKKKPNSSAHSRPSFLSRFQLDPQIFVVLCSPCLPIASGVTILGQTPTESCPHGVKIQGGVREAFGCQACLRCLVNVLALVLSLGSQCCPSLGERWKSQQVLPFPCDFEDK